MADGYPQGAILVSLAELKRDVAALAARMAHRMRERGAPWQAVVGVATGGVYPAGWIAGGLGLPYREIHISTYDGTRKLGAPVVLRGLDDPDEGAHLLVVDDVLDSGDTALCVRRILPLCDLVTVYTKPAGLRRVTAAGVVPFYARAMPEEWVVFPWDQPGWNEALPGAVAAYRRSR